MHYVHIYNVGLLFKVLDKSSLILRLPTLHFQSLSLGKRLQEIMSLNSRAIKMLSMVIFIVGNESNLKTFNIYRVDLVRPVYSFKVVRFWCDQKHFFFAYAKSHRKL